MKHSAGDTGKTTAVVELIQQEVARGNKVWSPYAWHGRMHNTEAEEGREHAAHPCHPL